MDAAQETERGSGRRPVFDAEIRIKVRRRSARSFEKPRWKRVCRWRVGLGTPRSGSRGERRKQRHKKKPARELVLGAG
jgi:hypothetical protein